MTGTSHQPTSSSKHPSHFIIEHKKYIVIKPIERGGSSTIYLASLHHLQPSSTSSISPSSSGYDSSTHYVVVKRTVAYDHFHLDYSLRELHILKQIQHPNIVSLYDASIKQLKPQLTQDNSLTTSHAIQHTKNVQSSPSNLINYHNKGHLYLPDSGCSYDPPCQIILILKYYPRGNLQQIVEHRLKKDGYTFKSRLLLRLFWDITKAVRVLHDNKPSLVHNDIKPSNITIDQDGSAVLLDFGSVDYAIKSEQTCREIHKIQDDITRLTTPAYRSPELWDIGLYGETSLSTKTDIWSLGCTFFYLAYGENPFCRALRCGGDLRLAINNATYRIPKRDHQGHLYTHSKHIQQCIESCLLSNPLDRISSESLSKKLLTSLCIDQYNII